MVVVRAIRRTAATGIMACHLNATLILLIVALGQAPPRGGALAFEESVESRGGGGAEAEAEAESETESETNSVQAHLLWLNDLLFTNVRDVKSIAHSAFTLQVLDVITFGSIHLNAVRMWVYVGYLSVRETRVCCDAEFA